MGVGDQAKKTLGAGRSSSSSVLAGMVGRQTDPTPKPRLAGAWINHNAWLTAPDVPVGRVRQQGGPTAWDSGPVLPRPVGRFHAFRSAADEEDVLLGLAAHYATLRDDLRSLSPSP